MLFLKKIAYSYQSQVFKILKCLCGGYSKKEAFNVLIARKTVYVSCLLSIFKLIILFSVLFCFSLWCSSASLLKKSVSRELVCVLILQHTDPLKGLNRVYQGQWDSRTHTHIQWPVSTDSKLKPRGRKAIYTSCFCSVFSECGSYLLMVDFFSVDSR